MGARKVSLEMELAKGLVVIYVHQGLSFAKQPAVQKKKHRVSLVKRDTNHQVAARVCAQCALLTHMQPQKVQQHASHALHFLPQTT